MTDNNNAKKFLVEELHIIDEKQQQLFIEAVSLGHKLSVNVMCFAPFDKRNNKNGFLHVTGEQLKQAVIDSLSGLIYGEVSDEDYNRAAELVNIIKKIHVNNEITEDSARLFCEELH